MADWLPYLHEILGHASGPAIDRTPGNELLTIAATLDDRRPQVDDRVRLLEWIAKLDDVRQVFLLPDLGLMLAEPSTVVRKRLLMLLQEIGGEDSAVKKAVQAIRTLLDAREPAERHIQDALMACEALVRQERSLDLTIPLAGLQFLRRAVFALALLAGVSRTAATTSARERLRPEMERFFDDELRAPLREQLHEWLKNGPLFLRYAMVRVLHESGQRLSEHSAAQTLLDVYRTDGDPLVASVALEAWAHDVEAEELPAALTFLRSEYRTFAQRPLHFTWDLPRADIDDGVGVRMLGVAILRALGIIAVAHMPDPRPLEELRRFVSGMPPSDAIRLDLSDRESSAVQRERVFRATLLLRAPDVRVRVSLRGAERGLMRADAGLDAPLTIADPTGLLAQHRAATQFWVEPIIAAGPRDAPERWTYRLCAVASSGDSPGTATLESVMSPAISRLRPKLNFVMAKEQIHRELDTRGWWIISACEAVCSTLETACAQGVPLNSPPLRALLFYVTTVGEGAVLATFTQQPDALRDRVKNKIASLFLNRIARPEVFDALYKDARERTLTAQFLASLAQASLRSLPGVPVRRWIDDNIDVLCSLVQSQAHVKARGAAALALAYGAWDKPRVREVLERLRLPFEDTYRNLTAALRFTSDKDLTAFCVANASAEAALRLAAGEDDEKGHGRLVVVFSEVLARAIAGGTQASPAADRAAAACLGANTRPQNQTRLRLLQAYAACPHELAGNVRRLLYDLLRTSSATELVLYFVWRAEVTRAPLPDAILTQLIVILSEDRFGHLAAGRRFDTTAVTDSLARRRIVLTLLGELAWSDRADFFQRYLHIRELQPTVRATGTIVAARGEVLRSEQLDEQLSVLRASTGDAVLADHAGDIVIAFAHQEQQGAELDCLAQIYPIPAGTLDLHSSPVADDIKRRWLQERIDAGQALLLARVLRARGSQKYVVDLGTGTEELARQQTVVSPTPLGVDDAIVIEVTRRDGPQLCLTSGTFIVRLVPPERAIRADLRLVSSPLQHLAQLDARRERRPYVLVATVRRTWTAKNGRVGCELDLGCPLTVKANELRAPRAYAQAHVALHAGAQIFVETRDLRLDTQNLIQFTTRVIPHGLLDQAVVRGTLRCQREAGGTSRRWSAVVGSMTIPLPREGLTGDLGTLFALDLLPDDHPILQRLVREPRPLRVQNGGARVSLIHVPPTWRVHDLTLAVLSGAAEAITFLSYDSQTGALIFEVHLRGNETWGARSLAETPLGTLVELFEGELFDMWGEPVLREALRRGLRLPLVSTRDHVRPDGTLQEACNAAVPVSGTAPHLRIDGRPDATNIEFTEAFHSDKPLRLRIVCRRPELLLALAEELPVGYPAPRLRYERERDFAGDDGAELDAVVIHHTVPATDEEFYVKVAPPRMWRVEVRLSSIPADVRELYDLEAGKLLHGRKRLRDGCTVDNLKAELDPLMPLLLPRPLDSRALEVATQAVPALVTRVERRRVVLTSLRPEDIPRVDGLDPVVGVVTGVAHWDGRGEVRWFSKPPEPGKADPVVSDPRPFDLGGRPYRNGDLLHVRGSGHGVRVWHQPRFLHVALIHEVVPFSTWVEMHGRAFSARSLWGVFVRGAATDRSDDRYLFVMEPASLVAVPTDALAGAGLLDEAWPLDRVQFALSWFEPKTQRDPIVSVQAVVQGAMHTLVNQRCTLDVSYHDTYAHEYIARLIAGPAGVNMPVVVSAAALPKVQSRAIAQAHPTPRSTFTLETMLGGYVLKVERQARDDRTESVRLSLDPQFVERPALKPPRKPALNAALGDQRGRLDNASGRVVHLADRGQVLGVELDDYEHTGPLPLPDAEQTWVPYVGHYVQPGWTGLFTILRDDDGCAFASLRRRRPMSLERWLDAERLVQTGHLIETLRLLHVGPLVAAHLADCGLDASASSEHDGDPAPEHVSRNAVDRGQAVILFEVAAGVCFTALPTQLCMFGERFDPDGMHLGDAIESFRVISIDDDGSRGLDLRKIVPDVQYDIESFHREHGIFFGSLQPIKRASAGSESSRQPSTVAEIKSLSGLGYSERPLAEQRRGRWKLRVEGIDEQQRRWLGALSPDDPVYLQFSRVERSEGVLYFRLMAPEKVFSISNLVYVRPEPSAAIGRSAQLYVRPLSRFGDPAWEYFIPDTLYSERLGWLKTTSRSQSSIYLARVVAHDQTGRHTRIKLSLRHTPPRRFGAMFSMERRQAIVKSSNDQLNEPSTLRISSDDLFVELSESVNVKLPRNRIDWQQLAVRHVEPGDVISFTPMFDTYRILVTDVRKGHREYFRRQGPRTVLTVLWQSPRARRAKLAEGRDATLNCSLVGLPLLKGTCRPRDEHVESLTPFPQLVKSYGGEWTKLDDAVGVDAVTALLAVGRDELPAMHADGKRGEVLPWSAVTVREGTFDALCSNLRDLKFRNDASDIPATLATTPVIGKRDTFGRISLTMMAARPLPIEHVIEQFPLRQELRRKAEAHEIQFVVASADAQGLVLEVAPGRYVELPTALVVPRHGENVNRNLRLVLTSLRSGDIVGISIRIAAADEFIPRFRARLISFGQSRHLDGPFTVPLQYAVDGTPLIGATDGLGFPMPALDDQAVDLRKMSDVADRYRTVRQMFAKYGRRLVLFGTVTHLHDAQRRREAVVDIGIHVPVQTVDGVDWRSPTVRLDGDASPAIGTALPLRVMEAGFDPHVMTAFTAEARAERASLVRAVRVQGQAVWRRQGPPHIGDTVVVRRDAGACRVAGFPSFAVHWIVDEEDCLQLHNPVHARLALQRLLPSPDTCLWATVEGIEGLVIRLSRRMQKARALPTAGSIVQARVIGALTDTQLLVDLGGLAWLLPLDRFGHGLQSLAEICLQDVEHGGLCGEAIEVVRRPDGVLSAIDVYESLPTRGELEGVVAHATTSGVVVLARGHRLFIPKKELAWCDLTGAQIKVLFLPGERLLVSLSRDGGQAFSHIRTHAIRTEFASLLRNAGDPVYVRTAFIDEAGQRAIVRGRSKVLMEMALPPGEALGERICAFVRRIDSRRRHVELSLDEAPVRRWHLPHLADSTVTVDATYAVDRMSPEVVTSSLDGLVQAIKDEGPGALGDWVASQTYLEPSPRNLRLLLECLAANGLSLIGRTGDTETRSEAAAAPVESHPFQKTWLQIVGLLHRHIDPVQASPIARFGAGYASLLSGQTRNAESHFSAAWRDGQLRRHFDVGLSRARALFLEDDRRGMELLRVLTRQIFAGALSTLVPPLLEPDPLGFAETDRAALVEAIASGAIGPLEQLFRSHSGKSPNAARTRSNGVWFLLAKGCTGPELDEAAEAFFHALRDDDSLGVAVDARLHLMAAFLSFARGRIVDGWWHLDRAQLGKDADAPVAAFWSVWLSDGLLVSRDSNQTELDRLLVALWRTWRQCRWRETVEPQVFQELWDAFRRTPVRWILGSATCRAVAEPPDTRDQLTRWAIEHGAHPALRPLLVERRLDEASAG